MIPAITSKIGDRSTIARNGNGRATETKMTQSTEAIGIDLSLRRNQLCGHVFPAVGPTFPELDTVHVAVDEGQPPGPETRKPRFDGGQVRTGHRGVRRRVV